MSDIGPCFVNPRGYDLRMVTGSDLFEFDLDYTNPLTYRDARGYEWQPDRHFFTTAAEFAAHKMDKKLAKMYSQMLVGMVALTGQWWLDVKKPKKEEVVAHMVNLAWNGLAHIEPKPKLTTR